MTEKDMEKPSKMVAKTSFDRVKNQFLMVIIGNILAFSQGTNMAWFSPALPVLINDPSPLVDGPISHATAGWIGSFLAVGGLCGCIGFGLLSNWIGYKRPLQFAAFPITVSWLLIIFGKYSWQICLSRFSCGLSLGASLACFPQFVAQIATDSVRGQLNSYIQIGGFSGILIGIIGGSYLPYNINPMVMIWFPVLYFIGFFSMPECPQYLLKNNREEEAENSLRYYRNVKTTDDPVDNNIVEGEFKKLKAIAKQTEQQTSFTVSDFVNPVALRAIIISPFLMAVNQFSGSFAITSYAETIYKNTGSTLDPQMSSIVTATVQVVGTYIASQLMDKVGRKVLLLVSLSGGFLALVITGTYSYLAKSEYDVTAFNWVPILSISSFIFLCSIGILPVPFVMLSEVIPQKIRRIASTFCTSVAFICQIIMLRLVPVLLKNLDLYGSMWLFSGVSMIGLLFTIFVVKETKGKNIDVLEENTNRA